MDAGRPDHLPGSTFAREHLLSWIIATSALFAFGTTGYSLFAGLPIVVSHFFYIPIVLAAYLYPDRGVAFAGVLAAGYLAEVLLFTTGSWFEVASALLRAGVFLVVAAVVSHLSGRLQTRERRYRGIFETSGAGVFIFSPVTGKIKEMNRGCAGMLGYPDGDVPPLEVSEVWPGYPGSAGALEQTGIEGLDCSLVRRDGTSCPVILSANLLPGRQAGCAVVTGTTEQKRMENRLRRSEATYRVILDTVDVGIVLTDPGRQVVEANKAAIGLFGGAGREDLIGRNPLDLVAARYREAARVYLERALRGEMPAPGECMLCRIDGSEWPAEVSATYLARDGDAPERQILVIRNITERRWAEEAMREENRRLSIVNEVIAAATASRRLDDLLQASLTKIIALLGFDHGAVYLMRPGSDTAVLRVLEGEGRILPAVVRRDDPFYRDLVLAGDVRCIEDIRARHPGSLVKVLVAVPIPGDDGPVGWFAVGSRTRETVPESERRILLAIGEELGSAVVMGMLQEDLEGALASANRYLDEANAATGEVNLYVDILTHDINNANTAAMGYLQMFLESAADESGVLAAKKSLAAIYQSNDIIRNVSTIRKIKAGSVELRPVQLGPVLREIRNYYSDTCITCEGADATVLADDLLPEIFVNLIGNAVKFGGPEVEVTVSVKEDGGMVSVTVADTGPGIPDDLKPRLFGRYQRGETKKGGKGLGLYIVRTLTERYGGSVRAGDRIFGRPEKGAAVTFTLRRRLSEAGDKRAEYLSSP